MAGGSSRSLPVKPANTASTFPMLTNPKSGVQVGPRLAWRASSTKWLTLPFSWGRKHGNRCAHGGLFALLREQPFLAWVSRAPEADGNFCGLNAWLRHAGLFGLAACCLPARSSSAASRPRHIHSCLCSWVSLLRCSLSLPSPVASRGNRAGPDQGRPRPSPASPAGTLSLGHS